MPYLQNEKARFQAEVQAAAAEIATLTTQRQAHQQAVSAAQARVSAAQTKLSDAQAQIPALETAVAAAEQRVAEANQQVEAHAAIEPDQVIVVAGRPRPNPAWKTWNTTMGQLTQQLDQAQADLTAAQTRLNDVRTQVSQATAEKQTAERQVADATRALAATDAAIAAARQRQAAAQAQVANVDRWNEAIARDPLVRPTLEQVAAELSARAAALADDHDVVRVQHEIAEETLASLVARRDRLTPALSQMNGQLPAASEELRVAREALATATRNIQRHRQRGPRP